MFTSDSFTLDDDSTYYTLEWSPGSTPPAVFREASYAPSTHRFTNRILTADEAENLLEQMAGADPDNPYFEELPFVADTYRHVTGQTTGRDAEGVELSVRESGEGSDCDTCGWSEDTIELVVNPVTDEWRLSHRFGCYGGVGYTSDENTVDEVDKYLSALRPDEDRPNGRRILESLRLFLDVRESLVGSGA